jgi:RND family efflux transporter MFP subunit
VDYTGQLVRKGQPLFSIYSPELVATQQEYLLAVKADRSLKSSEFADVSSGASALRESAYRRLKLWDVSDQQIKKLEETGKPMTTITFYSPVSGYVVTKNVFEKQRITYDTETYTIADLSTIWLMADIYEYEAPRVHVGQKATMTLSYNGKSYEGIVTYVYPDLNAATRTLKARIEFRNSDLSLKPGMYADVDLDTGHGAGLVIPIEAVLDSGERKIVFVQKSEGEFEPRQVELGEYLDDQVVVTKGLNAGEKIVASGNFLIDSESQLRSAIESMSTAEPRKEQ